MANHYENAATFTTKVGLCVNLRNLQWFDSADPDTFFPRCYVLGAEDEKHAFIEDFRRTACTSLLQHVVETQDKEFACSLSPIYSPKGGTVFPDLNRFLVESGIIETALRVCQEFLIDLDHGNIDRIAQSSPSAEEQQWADFLQEFYLVVHHGAEIRGADMFAERCLQMLTKLREVCPQLDTDGVNNIWIIKPGAKSRGRGITCMNRLDDIIALVDRDHVREHRWVWFLVTDWNPLTVWFYRECYLRFSTQPYSTKNLSVHLCNNSIQKHFQPSKDRNPALPEDNMWSCAQFRSFLSGQGREGQWESVVVPGMRQAVVRALQTAQDLVIPRRASFAIYGADFMLGRDLRPWLLEINSSPTMACSTAVTARLCPAVQRDTLRVVLDRRANPNAYTGGFQLIYKQPAVEVPQYVGVNLLIEGASIRKQKAVQKPPVSVSASAPVASVPLMLSQAHPVQRTGILPTSPQCRRLSLSHPSPKRTKRTGQRRGGRLRCTRPRADMKSGRQLRSGKLLQLKRNVYLYIVQTLNFILRRECVVVVVVYQWFCCCEFFKLLYGRERESAFI
uniref:Tubulin tyrosine ligase-like family, member 3 n=1 Tax=Neogobius melanostomus TaxID=47308 RepID=A0A8C6SAL5_9GOBI